MSKPITLWRPRRTLSSDDAGTTIHEYTLPSADLLAAPYQCTKSAAIASGSLTYVPPLSYFCIQVLLEDPHQVHSMGPVRLQYQSPQSPGAYDPLRALIPEYSQSSQLDISQVDPRLWAVLIQLYTNLPHVFHMYTLPLADGYLPLLQQIPCTEHFSVLTILELSGCRELTDDTVLALKDLHGLCAFDASCTALTGWGVKRLSRTLSFTEGGISATSGGRLGPWALRILSLRNCINVKNDIFDSVEAFPLLCILDLRGTQCLQPASHSFRTCDDATLYHPFGLSVIMSNLSKKWPGQLVPHPYPFLIRVKGLYYENDISRTIRDYDQSARRSRADIDLLQYLQHKPRYRFDSQNVFRDGVELGDQNEDSSWTDEYEDEHASYTDEDEDEDGQLGHGAGSMEGSQAEHHENSPALRGGARLYELSAVEHDHRNIIADTEARLYAARQSARHFYGLPGTPLEQPSSGLRAHVEQSANPSNIASKAGPLMLYRDPPSWRILPTPSSQIFEGTTSQKLERGRMESTTNGKRVQVDQVRNNARVRKDINNLHDSLKTRKAFKSTPASFSQEPQKEGRTVRPARSNPFLRGGPAQKSMSGSRKALPSIAQPLRLPVSHQERAPPPTEISLGSNCSGTSSAVTETAVLTTRRLKPISKLRIPLLPPSRSTRPSSTMSATKGSVKKPETKQLTLHATLRSSGQHSQEIPPTRQRGGKRFSRT